MLFAPYLPTLVVAANPQLQQPKTCLSWSRPTRDALESRATAGAGSRHVLLQACAAECMLARRAKLRLDEDVTTEGAQEVRRYGTLKHVFAEAHNAWC